MSKYDFHRLLEPYEFQYLVRDILQVKENCFFESFSPGKDGGIDLRKTENDNTVIVQIKRYKDDFDSLFGSLKKYELPKVKKLKPDRYMIVTSVDLSQGQKQKIFDLFCGYVKDTSDILSGIDLNNLLEKPEYHFIELEYPNLWFSSANTFFNKMDNLLNSDLYEDARDEYEEIQKLMKYYVPVSNFAELISSIKSNRFLLITGNPGIGKTSLARALCAYFIKEYNYQLIYTRNVESANRVYRQDENQIFFFDDFWGSSFKENDYNFNEERKLSEFIRKIKKSNNKLLVLTSRDYVLKQGLISNLELTDTFDENNYILDLKNYSLKLRYMILLRHLCKSKLKFNYIEYIETNCEKIIKHRNFNPRIIEYYLNSDFHLEVDEYRYFEFFIDDLDYPFSFLDKVYKKQSKEAQLLLYLLLTVDNSILFDDLKQLYLNALNVNIMRNYNLTNFKIDSVIDQLEKNFIRTKYIEDHGIVIEFVNNSIKDYLIEAWDNFYEFEQIILSSLTYFNQIEFLIGNKFNPVSSKLSKTSLKKINEVLLSEFDELNIIRGDFVDTIEFEKMTVDQQMIYKVRRLMNIKNLDVSVVNFLLDKIECVMNSLKQKDRKHIQEDDLASVIGLFNYASLYKNYDKLELIKIYYDNCKHTYELFLLNEFKEIFRTEYSKFIRGKKRIIDDKYREMAYYDIEYFYRNKMYQSLSELLALLDTDLYYICEADYTLRVAISYYGSKLWPYYDKVDKIMEQESVKNDYEDDMSQIKKFCPDLSKYYYDDLDGVDLVKDRAENILTKEKLQKLLEIIENKDYEYIKLFIHDKNSVDLVISYYNEFNFFPEKISDFCMFLIGFVIYQNKLQETDMFFKIACIGFETFLRNERVFTIESLKDYDIDVNDSNVQTILKSNLFVKEDKWIKFVNPVIQSYCIAKMILPLKSKEKDSLYSDIIFALSPYNQMKFDFCIGYFYYCLVEIDPKGFSNYFIYPEMKYFVDSIDNSNNRSVISSIIKFFALTVKLEKLSYKEFCKNSCSVINIEFWDLLNLFVELKLYRVINKDAFMEFKHIFKKYIKIDNNYYRINVYELLDKDEFFDWLNKYEIDKKILKLYDIARFIMNYCEFKHLDSFKKYKNIIEKNIKDQVYTN